MAYYVKVESPREFRRDILESSKKVIGCLQANRNVLEIRRNKRELLESLQRQVKELALLIVKFDEILPDKQLREEALQEQRLKDKEREEMKKERDEIQVVSSVDVARDYEAEKSGVKLEVTSESKDGFDEEKELNSALSSIEDKLSHLD